MALDPGPGDKFITDPPDPLDWEKKDYKTGT